MMATPDERLVERARRGDAAAFDELTERHLDAAYELALALLGSPDDAEDCVQDSFIRALERLDQCRTPARFRHWLLRIVRNRALNMMRHGRVRAAIPLDGLDLPSGEADPARGVDRGRLRERLASALALLTEGQRTVVVLHDLEGWRHDEIAEFLNIRTGASRALLFKARQTLRKVLGGQPTFEEWR
jgi:RNA polymerase sigma-70 factor (ECF subfamily)